MYILPYISNVSTARSLPGLQVIYQVDELPIDYTIKAYARDTGRGPNAQPIMRGIMRLTDFETTSILGGNGNEKTSLPQPG